MICRGGSAESVDLGWNWSSPVAVNVKTSGEEASATTPRGTTACGADRPMSVVRSVSMVFNRACTSALLLSAGPRPFTYEFGSSTPLRKGRHR